MSGASRHLLLRVIAIWAAISYAPPVTAQTAGFTDIELHFGGLGTDGANAIVAMADSGYTLGGWRTRDDSPDITEGWVVRVDSRGGYLWDLHLPRSAPYGITTLSPAFDGGLLVIDQETGQSKGTTRLSKLSPEGSIEWQRSYGETDLDIISSIRPTFDGGLIMAGRTAFGSDRPLTDRDANGYGWHGCV